MDTGEKWEIQEKEVLEYYVLEYYHKNTHNFVVRIYENGSWSVVIPYEDKKPVILVTASELLTKFHTVNESDVLDVITAIDNVALTLKIIEKVVNERGFERVCKQNIAEQVRTK